MYGFSFIIGGHLADPDIRYDNMSCKNNFIEKFEKDKIFYQDEDYIIILDGVILNKSQLQQNNLWVDTVISLYEKEGDTFFEFFRGVFAGALLNKKLNRWIIFSDQLGQKFIYYSTIGDIFICSSMITEIYSLYHQNNIKPELDTNGISFLLSYGFMLDNYTLCKSIKKIRPGNYLIYQNGNLEEKEYYRINNSPNYQISYNDAIDKIDKLFRLAVKTQFSKDEEYGYKHICALSGGLDCRMTSYVAHDLGYKRQLNVTFSESDYWDHIIPQKMAIDWKHDWLYKPLDNGMWLYDVEEISKTTGGNVLYYGTAHSNSLYKYTNFKELGMLHSGQMGDVVIGSHMKKYDEPYIYGEGAYSKQFLNNSIKLPHFENKEIGLWYCRYLNGTNNGIQNTYNYTETCSPFLDINFLSFCLSLPVDFRFGHKIYKDWIIKKYPAAAEYVWETTGAKIDEKMIKLRGHNIPKKHFFNYTYNYFKYRFGFQKKKYSMQQIGEYLKTNVELFEFLKGYLQYVTDLKDENLVKSVINLWDNGTVYEKIQVISLLAALKMYFRELS